MRTTLDPAEEQAVRAALRQPRGHYPIERAAQLSGVPRSTIYNWRRERVYVPDFDGTSPLAWSYRDLVYLRLVAWLRQLGMPRPAAAERVSALKTTVGSGAVVRRIRADRHTLVLDDEGTTQLGDQNLLPFDDFLGLLSPFDLFEPVDELRRRGHDRGWAPDLVRPSDHTSISPWVLAGEPCVRRTRIPTASIHALREERGLSTAAVVALYPGLDPQAADDAHTLERRLRGVDLPAPAAA